MSFVNSIITDKVKYTKGQDPKKDVHLQAQPKEDQMNDLSLIQAIQEQSSSSSKPKEVGILRGVQGLGYQVSQAELESQTQIQRLKNQIRQQQKDKEELAVETKHPDHEERQVSAKKSHGGGDIKQQMLDSKQEKKRDKKLRQKTKKEDEIAKVVVVAEVKPEEKSEERPSERRYENTERVRIRTKTRSKQKNKKRDNRPIEVKRAKLAERGIVI